MADSPMKKLAPRLYLAGPHHLKPGLVLWLGPKRPKPFGYALPWWRRLHHRHVRVVPLPRRWLRDV